MPFIMGIRMANIMIIMIMGIIDENMLPKSVPVVCSGIIGSRSADLHGDHGGGRYRSGYLLCSKHPFLLDLSITGIIGGLMP